MEKAIIPRKVAESLEFLRSDGFKNRDIIRIIDTGTLNDGIILQVHTLKNYSQKHFNNFLMALAAGYEIGKTPEEELLGTYTEVSEFYEEHKSEYDRGIKNGIILTLDTLEIKVNGIN